MNALIFVLILLFAPGSTEASAASVWLVLVVVEWLADRFAGWLWLGSALVCPPDARAGSRDLGSSLTRGTLSPVRQLSAPCA